MKTVLYGGAFDPVHCGHVFVGHEALRLMAPCILVVIPTGLPNPDFGKRLSGSDADRMAMLRLAFAGVPNVVISDIELDRGPQPSYFIDTIERLHPSLGDEKPALLLGEDQLLSFTEWHRYRDILDHVELWFVPRAGGHRAGGPRVAATALFDINPFDGLSSSLIRDRLQQGLPVDGLVPPSVAAYIAEHALYKSQ
ncbi:MAG TPA: nicotinate (nicotinamide) nucleotide adenylyltransferase [Clostridia bacterium]|nr:nicotinate (nicotinamide) nucleotide adenylyltransferase [Clostridia bacterium]